MKPLAYIAIASLAATAGFGLYRHALAPSQPPQAQAIPFSGIHSSPAGAAAQAAALAPGVPAELPDFTLADLEGIPRSIKSWPGKSMIVNFWATWCAPCRREIPLLNRIQQQHADSGFQVVGVAVDFRDDVLRYAQDIGIHYPVLIGEQEGLEAVSQFGQGGLGFPFTVFTDRQHRIVMFHLGELHAEQAQVLLDVVAQVDRGELTPAQARAAAARQLTALEAQAARPDAPPL